MSGFPGVSRSLSLASTPNPFSHEVVPTPWDRAEADAPQINAEAFAMCCRLIREHGTQATFLLMYGVAGGGKTHLLARVRTYLQASPEGSRTVFVSVRMDAAPIRLWRNFRRHFTDDLLRPWKDTAPRLQLILRDRLRESSRPGVKELVGDLHLNYSLGAVLSRYEAGIHRAECVAWLRGEPLPKDALHSLGVADAEAADEEQMEEQAREIVFDLCRVAAPDLVVFCFDQLEALESFPGDQRGLFAYAKLAAAFDKLSNVFVISAVQSMFVDRLQQGSDAADFQRISQHRIDLHPLTWEQGKQLLQSRMAAVPELAGLRSGELANSLWPLNETALRAEFQGDSCVARKLIHRAKLLFEVARGMPALPPRTLDELLTEKWSEYSKKAFTSGSDIDSDDILSQGLPAALDLVGRRIASPDEEAKEAKTTVDVLARSAAGAVPVCICNQNNMIALGNRFKKILDEAGLENRLAGCVLVRDQRRQISETAVRCREKLERLKARGARLVEVAPEVMAALGALRKMLADANTGDILHHGEAVAPRSVRDWLASHVPSVVEKFIEHVTAGRTSEDNATEVDRGFEPKLVGYVQEQCVASVEQAAEHVQASAEEIAAYAQGNPTKLMYLAGPPAILFCVVGTAAEAKDV